MWKTVHYPQQQSASSRARARVTREVPSSSPDDGAAPPSAASVKRLAKDLRRTAAAIPQAASTSLATVLLPSVVAFLAHARARVESESLATSSSTPSRSAPRLTLIALGIGAFERRESRAGFLQMASLVALKELCERQWCASSHAEPPCSSASPPHLPTNANCTRSSDVDVDGAHRVPTPKTNSWTVETRFYEPLATPLHKACCEKLGIHVEKSNRFGRYTPRDDREFVILLMPHCPWVLLHNTLAANWPTKPTDALVPSHHDVAAGGTPQCRSLPIQRVLWLANDIRSAPFHPAAALPPAPKGRAGKAHRLCIYSEALLSCLDVIAVEGDSLRSKRTRRTRATQNNAHASCECAEEESDAVGGLGPQDVREAFSDMAVMFVKRELIPEAVTATLTTHTGTPPSIIEVTMEL